VRLFVFAQDLEIFTTGVVRRNKEFLSVKNWRISGISEITVFNIQSAKINADRGDQCRMR
jgi:hypothetical protein